MEAPAVRSGDTLYLVHSSGLKFWEIAVLDLANHVRYGKLKDGSEEEIAAGSSLYSSHTETLARAQTLVQAKLQRDYHILAEDDKESSKAPASEFARVIQLTASKGGTHMELQEAGFTSFWKVQVQGSQVRVEKGVQGGRPASWVNTYVNDEEAGRAGRAEVRDKLARGFRRCEESLSKKAKILEIDLEEQISTPQIDPTPPVTPKTSPIETPSTDLGQALAGTGLERYLPMLESEGVVLEELGLMTEDDFERLGIPAGASTRLKKYVIEQSPQPEKRRKIEDSAASTSKKAKVGVEGKSLELLRAFPWEDSIDPKGWLITEALEGLKCMWTGEGFLQKSGQSLYAPVFFSQGLPTDFCIDGVLLLGRGEAKKTQILSKRADSELWKEAKFLLFDAPNLRKPLEERIFHLQDLASSLQLPHVLLPQYAVCRDTDHLHSALQEVVSAGGQGLFLRQPGSFYDPKRSKTLLTVRPTHTGEATLVNYEPGKGRLEGLVSAFVVRSETGLEFRIQAGISEEQRRNPPNLGSKVRFQYQEKGASGAPKSPVYLP